MQIKKITSKGYNLHLLKNNNFKNVVIRIVLKRKLVKEEITKDSLLSDILGYSTNKYPTLIDMTKKELDLYGAFISSSSMRLGNYSIIDIYASSLLDKYTEPGNIEETIKLLSEIIFNPNVKDNKFDIDSFNIVKKRLENTISRQKDNQSGYAELKMLESMSQEAPYSCNVDGYLDQLEQITSQDLYQHYLKFMQEAIIDIYVIGEIKYQEMENIFKKHFDFSNRNTKTNDIFIEHNPNIKEQIIKEQSNFNQSKLSIGCKLIDCNSSSKISYPLFIYNNILGGMTNSKLFQSIREQESLAYYANSQLFLSDNLIIISSGIAKENFERVVALVKQEMQEMIDGNFTEEEISSAKEIYRNAMESLNDSASELVSAYFITELFNIDTIEERIKEVDKVTKQDIMNVAKRVVIDTIYLLEDGDDNENN